MAARTPRRRNVQVSVSLPRRSPRTQPASINNLHNAAPLDSPQVLHTQFESDAHTELSAAYRHALEDSEAEGNSLISASPAVAARQRRTPQKKTTTTTTAVGSARRTTRRKNAGLDLSDEDTDGGTGSDSVSSRSSASGHYLAPHHGSEDETRWDGSSQGPLPVPVVNTAALHRQSTESSLAAPLSPILEESPKSHSRNSSRANVSLSHIDWDSGASKPTLGRRISSALSHLWWLGGSRLYLIASAILCWDVWLIVSAQHLARVLVAPLSIGSKSSTRTSAAAAPAPSTNATSSTGERHSSLAGHPASAAATSARTNAASRGKGSSAHQLSAPLSLCILLLVALLIFSIAFAFFSKVERASSSSSTIKKKVIVKDNVLPDNMGKSTVTNMSEAELNRLITNVLNKHLQEHSQQVDDQLQASQQKLLSEVEEAVMKILTKPSTVAYRHWDSRLSSVIDTKSSKVQTEIQDRVSQDQKEAVTRQDGSLKRELQTMQASIKQQLAEKISEQKELKEQLGKLTSGQKSFDAQLSAVESRLLDKISQQSPPPPTAAVPETTATPGLSEEEVQGKIDAVETALRDKLNAVEKLLKVLEAQHQDTVSQLSDLHTTTSSGSKINADIDSNISGLSHRIDELQTAQQRSDAQLTSSTKDIRSDLLSTEDVSNIAAAVVRRIASDESEFADLHAWMDKRYAMASTSICAAIPNCKKQLLDLFTSDFRDLVKDELASLPATQPQVASPASDSPGLTRDTVSDMITTSIDEYAADRIGRYDFALAAQGGQVYADGTSPSYDPGVRMKLLGISLFSLSYPPRLAISPEVLPGNCWPFAGSEGHITIVLSAAIAVTHVSVDHIPASLTTDGSRSSAPRQFSVVALAEQADKDGQLLGEFEYRLDQPAVQTFDVKGSPKDVRSVRFNFASNHGHSDYTCLYRLRVHGSLSMPPPAA